MNFLKTCIIFLLPFIAYGKQENHRTNFTKFGIYNYSKNESLNTLAAKREFSTAERKEKIEITDVDKINDVLFISKRKKYVPAILGGNAKHLFCYACESGNCHEILISTSNIIYDLSIKKIYIINDEQDKKWLQSLVERVYK